MSTITPDHDAGAAQRPRSETRSRAVRDLWPQTYATGGANHSPRTPPPTRLVTVGLRTWSADGSQLSAHDPLARWAIMTERMDESQLKRQVYWHALPVGWEQLDYPTFLERRRQLS